MEAQKGSHVAVNLAPFIGSAVRSRQSVPCRVLEVQGDRVKVCTEEPHRYLSLWIQSHWIDDVLEVPCAAHSSDSPPEQSAGHDSTLAKVRLRPDRRSLTPA